MRQVVWLLFLFVVAVIAAGTLGNNEGLVVVYWPPWRIDLSLNLFVLLWVAVGVAAYLIVGAGVRLAGLPERARIWRGQQRERGAQAALREAQGLLFAGRFSRAHKAARRALEIRAATPELRDDAEFAALAHLLAASSLHRLQDRVRRDEQLQVAQTLLGQGSAPAAVAEAAQLMAAEWAVEDRDAERALGHLALLPAGVGRRTQALRVRLQAHRLARQPLEALKTARLLAKHQAFAPAAAQGLLRSLAAEALDSARDADQLRRVWMQLENADRRDPFVTAKAALQAAAVGSAADARGWLRPHWEELPRLGELERAAVLEAFLRVLPGLSADWLPLLEASVVAMPQDPAVAHVVGRAMAERKLWGRSRRLLESATSLPGGSVDLRRQAWRALAEIAEAEGDEARAQHFYRQSATGT